MQIFVLGNGFDISVGLPTRYMDFLNYMEMAIVFINDPVHINLCDPTISDKYKVDQRVIDAVRMDSGNISNNIFSFSENFINADKNFWIRYFRGRRDDLRKHGHENWLDFEYEITKVIKVLDNIVNTSKEGLYDIIDKKKMPIYLNPYIIDRGLINSEYKELKLRLR